MAISGDVKPRHKINGDKRNGNQVVGDATKDAAVDGIRKAVAMLGKTPAVRHGAKEQYRIGDRQGASILRTADDRSAAAAGCERGEIEEPARSSRPSATGSRSLSAERIAPRVLHHGLTSKRGGASDLASILDHRRIRLLDS